MRALTTSHAVLAMVLAVQAAGCGTPRAGAADALREHRAEVRDLLADLVGPAVESGAARAELRGSYEGCRSDALTQGYRSWTYAAGGRIAGGATLDDLAEALEVIGATPVSRSGREVRASRGEVSVAVTRHDEALVVSARAQPCIEVPGDQSAEWFDREPRPRIRLGR
jgi:hypothetical protein